MKPESLKDRDSLTQFLFTLIIVIACWLFFQLFSILTGGLIFGVKMNAMQSVLDNLDKPIYVNYLKYVQSFSSIGLFVVPSFIAAYLLGKNPYQFLSIDKKPAVLMSIMVSVFMLVSLPVNNYLSYLNAQLQLPDFMNGLQHYFEAKEESGEEIMQGFLNTTGFGSLLINLLVVAIIPALGEELFFRGILQKLFIKWTKNIHIGVIVTGVVFGLMHFQFLSLLPRIVQGIMLGYMLVWTKSLWIPIIAHFVNNAVAVSYYHYYYQDSIGDSLETMGTPEAGNFYVYLSVVGMIGLIYFIKKLSETNLSQTADYQEC